ncbi:MAG: SIMPL domain-containing protein [Candidatus Bathyarchaeia archaeon]
MSLKRYGFPIAILALLITASAALIMYTLPEGHNSSNTYSTGLTYAAATQQGEQHPNSIMVTGSGTASMKADKATVVLGVQTEDKSASEAVRLNAEAMNRVISALKSLGISEENMKTVSYSVYPVYASQVYDNKEERVTGYRVVNMISVETFNVSLVGKVIDVAVANGANQLQGVTFGLSEEKQYALRRQAYLRALGDAEDKAKLIAETLGLSITGVAYVSESSYQPIQPYWDFRYMLNVSGYQAAPTPILEGNISVSVTVSVTYTFTQ